MFFNTIKKIIKQKYVVVLLILQLFDLILTCIGLKAGYIGEGNPLANDVYNYNFAIFITSKLFITFLATFIIGLGYLRYKWVKTAIWVPLIAYTTVIGLHGIAIGMTIR